MIKIPRGQQFRFGIGNHSSSRSFEGLLIKQKTLDNQMTIGRSISRLASFAASIRRSNWILSGAVPDANATMQEAKKRCELLPRALRPCWWFGCGVRCSTFTFCNACGIQEQERCNINRDDNWARNTTAQQHHRQWQEILGLGGLWFCYEYFFNRFVSASAGEEDNKESESQTKMPAKKENTTKTPVYASHLQ